LSIDEGGNKTQNYMTDNFKINMMSKFVYCTKA